MVHEDYVITVRQMNSVSSTHSVRNLVVWILVERVYMAHLQPVSQHVGEPRSWEHEAQSVPEFLEMLKEQRLKDWVRLLHAEFVRLVMRRIWRIYCSATSSAAMERVIRLSGCSHSMLATSLSIEILRSRVDVEV